MSENLSDENSSPEGGVAGSSESRNRTPLSEGSCHNPHRWGTLLCGKEGGRDCRDPSEGWGGVKKIRQKAGGDYTRHLREGRGRGHRGASRGWGDIIFVQKGCGDPGESGGDRKKNWEKKGGGDY